MPSSEECIEARSLVRQWAIEALIGEGHPLKSAEEIVKFMPYDEQVKTAEKIKGTIYRGPYSPY